MLTLHFDPKFGVWVDEPESIERLQKNFFGVLEKGKLWLEPEEAMYLMNFQRAKCLHANREIRISDIVSFYSKKIKNLFITYNAYRDWRDRGLVLKKRFKIKRKELTGFKRYPVQAIEKKLLKTKAMWFSDSMFALIEDEKIGKELFEKYWIGQFGVYKQNRGRLLKLDFLETIFLIKHFGLDVESNDGKKLTIKKILNQVKEHREWALQLYDVYEEWRLRGFIVKTGFKFGTHFRIYFPGVSPVGRHIHSKHVLHVFPREQKLLVSEWARVVRVAHGVRKTFVLAIPKLKQKDYRKYKGDFIAWGRKRVNGRLVRETPSDKPRYFLVALSEDEHIGGIDLASMLKEAQKLGLELMLSITDRETSITYYLLKRVLLLGSKYEYYEIEWLKP